MKRIRIFEAFAGIGSQRKALERVKKDRYQIVGLAEWHVPAIIMYESIHNGLKLENIDKKTSRKEMESFLSSKTLSWDSKNPVSKDYWKRKHLDALRIAYTAVKNSEKQGNIFDVKLLFERTLKGIDLLTYSFPCQDLSQQGIQRGMTKNSGTRSGLLWEIEKALDFTNKEDLPKYLLMENVAALLHNKNSTDFKKWVNKLEKLGYKNSYGILNAADFGSAQARRRVFMISTLVDKVELPIGKEKNVKILKDILETRANEKDFMPALEKYDLSTFNITKSNIKKATLIQYSSFNSESYVYDPNFTGPTLTASGANSRIKIVFEGKIRKMNAKEAFRYMGFDEEDYENIDNLNFINEQQKIFACGNSICVEVLEKIMEKFK